MITIQTCTSGETLAPDKQAVGFLFLCRGRDIFLDVFYRETGRQMFGHFCLYLII